jgi:hypothetical protein
VINFNVNEVWAYADSSSTEAGNNLVGYVEGFISALDSYLEKYGDDGKKHFNEAVTQSELTLAVNEIGDDAPAIDAEVKGGVFRILFSHTRFGLWQSYLSESFLKAIEGAPREGFSLVAKHSIEEEYMPEAEDLTKEIADILAMPDVILDPNWDENYAILNTKDDKSWQSTFGQATLAYFQEGLKAELENKGFKDDDMLQEGFAEAIPSKTIRVRAMKELKSGKTNEPVIEDGVLYLQANIDRWGSWASYVAEGLLELL